MDKIYFFIISAVASTFFLSFGPILYNRYLGGTDSTHDSNSIIAGNIRQKPRIKIVCGNLENIPCDVCKLFVVGLRELVGRQAPEADIVKFAIELCDTFHIEDERVCQGIVRMFKVSLSTSNKISYAILYHKMQCIYFNLCLCKSSASCK